MNFIEKLARFRIGVGAFSAGDYGDHDTRDALIADPDGDIITSLVASSGDQLHIPVLDIDMGVHVVESTTPGHHHVYIDTPMTWRQYKRLLKALARAGVIEKDWYQLARSRKLSAVRVDGGTVPAHIVHHTTPQYEVNA